MPVNIIEPEPLPAKVSPAPLLPEMTFEKVLLPVVMLLVMVRVEEPIPVVIPQMSVPVPDNVKSPPIVKPEIPVELLSLQTKGDPILPQVPLYSE